MGKKGNMNKPVLNGQRSQAQRLGQGPVLHSADQNSTTEGRKNLLRCSPRRLRRKADPAVHIESLAALADLGAEALYGGPSERARSVPRRNMRGNH